MSDIKFNCPHCQQRLSIPDVALGRTIPCPICKGHIGLPAKRTPPPQSAAAQAATADQTTIATQTTASAQTTPATPTAATTQTTAAARTADKPPAASTAGSQTQQNVDIKFACPTCAVHIVITERAAGKEITCQRCGSRIFVPGGAPTLAAASQPSPPLMPSQATIPELIEELRNGNEQVWRALLQKGESVIPLLIEAFNENAITEPDTNRGADHIVKLLARCGAVCVQPLIAKLGKSRHAYYALGKIANEEALNALSRELTSVNWHRVEIACKALGLVENPNVQKYVSSIEAVRKSTRVGEVFSAASASLAAIQARFPKAPVSDTSLPPAKVIHGTAPLKVTAAIAPPLTNHRKTGGGFASHQKLSVFG